MCVVQNHNIIILTTTTTTTTQYHYYNYYIFSTTTALGMRYNGLVGAIYYVSLFILGNYVALNLFLAILLQNFGEEQENGSSSSSSIDSDDGGTSMPSANHTQNQVFMHAYMYL